MKKIELYFLLDDYTWCTAIVEVPAEIADSMSEDCYNAWLVTPAGQEFMNSWSGSTVCTGVYRWGVDVDDPRVDDGE